MRIIGKRMMIAVLLSGLAASAAWAQETDGDLHSEPPKPKAFWDGWFAPAAKPVEKKPDKIAAPPAGPTAAEIALGDAQTRAGRLLSANGSVRPAHGSRHCQKRRGYAGTDRTAQGSRVGALSTADRRDVHFRLPRRRTKRFSAASSARIRQAIL